MESIVDYLHLVLREGKIPLSYVILTVSDAKSTANDKPGNYDTPQQEMTSLALHKNLNDTWLPMFLSNR